ncbi:MAG: preprotein translocase subunit YajC [Phycisphaerae bacterium]|jgi:preprotein translocase subunit YajC|nr:preprotein translocase subunit YajC [Phycisphaerae bacterium]
MRITRTLLLTLIAVVLVAGLTTPSRAQDTQPAKDPGTDPAPKLTDADESDGKTDSGDASKPAGKPTTQPAGGPKKKSPSFFNPQMMLLLGGMVLLFVFMGRGKRKTEAKRKEMLATLKKGDKVTTIGGIIGTVMELRDDEVVVKTDESNNARMRFARWAVRGVGDQAKSENQEEKKK